ncbi:Protein mms22 [Penicillium rolfsii]|nr:Protein mms22 [Penicillium rolfsii]
MQMEPWRKRGFVPDSDEEDGFDSLDTSHPAVDDATDEVDLDYIPIPTAMMLNIDKRPANAKDSELPNATTPSEKRHSGELAEGSQELIHSHSTTPVKKGQPLEQELDSTSVATESPAEVSSQAVPLEEQLSKPRRVPRTYGKRNSATKLPSDKANEPRALPPDFDDDIWDIPTSPVTHVRSDRKTKSKEATPESSRPAPSLERQANRGPESLAGHPSSDIGRSRSSSPDELAFILPPPPKNFFATNHSNNVPAEKIAPQDLSDDDSPLSSPPSSLHSSPPNFDKNEMETSSAITPPENPNPNALDLEIPREFSTERIQPARRSFRERNAIQLHPYALEMAKYQRLMQERGIRPVRMAIPAQKSKQNDTTDESQEQDDFNPNILRSSPPPEEFLPPVRSARRPEGDSTRRPSRQRDHQTVSIQRVHSQKRRKKSNSNHWRERSLESHGRPRVVINVNTTANDPQESSIFDVPSSPPHSRSVSSSSRTPRASDGLQFSFEFTPPPTTTGGESKTATPGVGEVDGKVLHPPDDIIEIDDDSETQASRQASAEPEASAEDRRIRELQRRTRGVLPASWVRLNAEQSENPKANQNHRQLARIDGKGIAKKITRKTERSGKVNQGPSRALFDFADFGESEDDDDQSTNISVSASTNAQERLAGILELENVFDRDGDAMEDDRIDYMLAPISRKTFGPREKGKGVKRVKSKESSGQNERRLKKARLQRQTRLTDSSYGGRRTKQTSSRLAPRLGILDAPDVAARPRKEQPQFLRIAARGARSRQDQGRQSPTRKFVQLSSRLDTADANQSLRDWKRGVIPRAKTTRTPAKPRKRQTLTGLSNGSRRAAPVAQSPRITNHFASAAIDTIADHDDQPMPVSAPARDSSVPIEIAAPSNATIDTASAAQSERRGHQWIIQRNMPITSLRRNDPRPAPTSLAAPQGNQSASKDLFRRSLTLLNRSYRHEYSSRTFKPSLTLDRYISDKGLAASQAFSRPSLVATETGASDMKSQSTRRRLKKHRPIRINIESDEFVQNQDPTTTISDDSDSPTSAPAQTSSFSLGGMFNWQRSYSIDFGILPLRDGTFFHESTFIGSGDFSRSLQVTKRNLDNEAGFSSIAVKDRMIRWGSWNDKVSSELGSVFDMILADVDKSASLSPPDDAVPGLMAASHAYRSIVTYISDHLSFIDPVDRKSFVSRTTGLVSSLRDSLAAIIAGTEYNKSGLVRIACYNLLFANQILQLSSHDLVQGSLTIEALNLVKLCATDTIALILSETGMVEIRRLFEENKQAEQRETGLREQFPTAEAYVITKTLFRSSNMLHGIFNELQVDTCAKIIARNDRDVARLETGWRQMFSLLPFHDIDNHGIARRETRFKAMHDNWSLVKKLLSPVLDNYRANVETQPISYNVYCRTLFQRCHRLINVWGWRECRPILDTLYDFFAQNTLYNLRLEEGRGSPSFLDELDQNPSLELQPGEPCFHTLLKIIASGLRFLSERYDDKKVRNFAWRLLPNHGRVYPKEKPLLREDLDALRNHHDLLCTLYWVIPPGLRFRVEIIRDLVHPASSHNETCSINLRAWTRLVRFKLSTNEDIPELEPFANWHSFFVSELRQQHAHARKEIEAQSKSGERVSQHLIESTIAQNQRPIENLLSMALNGMQTAVERAPSIEHALRLIAMTPFESLLGLFNPKLARVNIVVSDALQVIMAYVQKAPAIASGAAVQKAIPATVVSMDDDSQEFEDVDWDESLDHAMIQPDPPSEAVQHVEKVLHPVVSRLLSNCFGEDHCPEDAILTSVVDCWTSIAQIMVFHKFRQWDNYLDPVSVESWASLRETVQTRKFTPRFLAGCIEKDGRILSDSRVLVMGMWISSLAERSSMLKFQHRLTEALLNGSPCDPLLQNLPFTKDKKSERYEITLEELSQRRISLLSSILSNMREHVLNLEALESPDLNVTKQEYSEMLQRLMSAMRSNYQELGNGAVESAQGAYVDFVHRIIRFLQELTSDIRPVDPFFTDPAVFPLPSSDPRYIVAKLKRYEPKLCSSKELQTLTMFIQSIVERATMDGQHHHLASQLHSAMTDSYESGMLNKPTLRATLLQCVFPAYIELAFSTSTAWLLCLPIVKSITFVYNDLLFNLNTMDSSCVSSVLRIFEAVFQSTYQALRPLSNRPALLRNPVVLILLTAFVDMISSSLVVVDYVDRVTDAAEGVLSFIEWFREFFRAVSSLQVESTSDAAVANLTAPSTSGSTTDLPPQMASARRLAFEDHQSCLRNWSFHDSMYYYTRPGHDSKLVTMEPEVTALIDNADATRLEFEDAVSDFVDRVERFKLLPE